MRSETLPSTLVIRPMTRQEAADLTKRLLGSYPSLSLHEPEIYIASIVSLLCGYSLEVGTKAVDQTVKTCKFVPTVAEVKEACDEYAPSRSMTWADDWDRRSEAQLAAREAREQAMLGAPKQTFEALADEMAARGIFMFGRRRGDNEFTAEKVRAKYGLTQEQWDAIPNAPPDSTWARVKVPA